jgi:NADPH:quinone reductase-like Zn-dependent oxidoreductase
LGFRPICRPTRRRPCHARPSPPGLTDSGACSPGESVVTIRSGDVALFVLQFAKIFGARTIAITSSEGKIALLKQLGADEVINYHKDRTEAES